MKLESNFTRLQTGQARLFGPAALRTALRRAAAAGRRRAGRGVCQVGAAAHGRGGRGSGTVACGGPNDVQKATRFWVMEKWNEME